MVRIGVIQHFGFSLVIKAFEHVEELAVEVVEAGTANSEKMLIL